jgi:hypothetical protein
MRRSLLSARGLGSLLPTSARDWAHSFSFPHLHGTGLTLAHACAGTGLTLAHACAGTWLTPAHACAGTGLTPAHACARTGLTLAGSTLVESLDLNTMHAHVCTGALRRAHVPSDGAASMPYAARSLQPGSAARSVGGRVLLQRRRIAALPGERCVASDCVGCNFCAVATASAEFYAFDAME